MRWDKWWGGLVNTVIGGVAGAAAGAFAEWRLGDPLDWHGLGTIVIVMSAWNFFSYLKEHPLPIGEDVVDTRNLPQ